MVLVGCSRVSTVAACQHKGLGAYCYKCGAVINADKKSDYPKCESGHDNMKNNLGRNNCTYCGKKL